MQKAINEKQDWFSRMCADIQKLQKTSDPPVLAAQFMQVYESGLIPLICFMGFKD